MVDNNDPIPLAPAMTESERNYFAPPIIDATIELRFENALSEVDRERVSKRFAKRYPLSEEATVQRMLVNVQPTGVATHMDVQERLARRRSVETPAVMQIGNFVFDVATGAPYPREMGEFQAVLAADTFAERHLYDAVRKPGWVP